MKRILLNLLIITLVLLPGCKKEYAIPTITAPAVTTVEIGQAVDLTFSFAAEAGFKNATIVATGGTATIKTNGTSGATTGSVVVTFTAGTTVGAGSVKLTITDKESQVQNATGILSLFEEGAPIITTPTAGTVQLLKTVDISFAFTSEGGYKSAAPTATGGTAVVKTAPAANALTGTVVVTFTAARTIGAGSVTLSITDNNNKVGQAVGVLDVQNRPTVSVTGNITANTTWETGKIYILEGRIAVVDGVTLTIQPGVIVKGREGSASNATALLIARGGKLNALGTALSPIIFTSVGDYILPGEIASPNLQPNVPGLWGGLLILGKAPVSVIGDAVEYQIEGIPVTDANGRYGGTVSDDNSGTIQYISIRHGGANIGEGNEINGLTLGGVGSGTVIENVEIVANDDDGIEFFGGTVNVKNALVWNPFDDGIDTDQSWAGTLDNFIVIAYTAAGVTTGTDHTLEIDGPEGSMLAAHTLKNGSIKGSAASEIGDFRSAARGTFEKIFFFNFPSPVISAGRGDLTLSGTGSIDNFTNSILVFNSLEIAEAAGVALNTIFLNGTVAHATSKTSATKTVGASKTPFAAWSWASVANQLTDF